MKRCTRCGIEKPANLEAYPPHKMGKYGVHSLCRPCKKLDDAERRNRPDQLARQQAWRDANKKYIRDYNEAYRAAGYSSTQDVARWRARNIEHCREQSRVKMRRYREANPQKYRSISRDHYRRNKEAIIRKMSERYRSDAWYNLKCKFAARIRMMLRGTKFGRTTESILGYSRDELVAHIEKQFTRGTSWEKVFSGEIHIDHIIPVTAFKFESTDDADFKACWALANLRPMWAAENISKNNKVLTLL